MNKGDSMKKTKWMAMAALVVLTAPWMVAGAQAPATAGTTVQAIPEDQQATQEQINKLFQVMRIKDQMATVSRMMPQIISQQFKQQMEEMKKEHPELDSVTPEQQQAMAQVMQKYTAQMMSLATGDDMLKDMGALYRKHLTQADADGIIAFYSTPAGQHLMDMTPVVMQEFMPTEMAKIQAQIKPILEQMSKEMEAIVKPGQ